MKTFKVVYEHFRVLFLLTVALMLFLPFGTFDWTQPEFYACIVTAVITYSSIILLLRRFQTDFGKKRGKEALEIPVSIVFMSVAFMIFMPYGTFDPGKPGFYSCIVAACMTEFSIRFLLKRYQSPPPTV